MKLLCNNLNKIHYNECIAFTVKQSTIRAHMFKQTRLLFNSKTLTPYEIKISDLLSSSTLKPSVCKVQDVSGGCGSMFNITIKSKEFNDLNKIKQHKLVNRILKDEIAKWHGLVLTTEKDL